MTFTFTAEDGTGLADANSLVTVAQITDFADGRGLTTLSAESTANKQIWAVNATDWIETVFAGVFKGRRKNRSQALSWPRIDVVDLDGFTVDSASVPVGVQNAVIEAVEWVRSGKVLIKNSALGGSLAAVNVGPLGVEWQVPPSIQPVMTKAATWLAHYLDRAETGRVRFVPAVKA